jgi:PAS domain S-box-containing protein
MLRNLTISRKLTWLNMLVSGAALALACAAFLAYDQATYRTNLVANVSTQADVVGLNSVSALVFNDPDAARTSLRALANSHNVLAATLFNADGTAFASYARDPRDEVAELPPLAPNETERHVSSGHQVMLARKIVFQGKFVGTIVLRGDLSDLQHRLFQYLQIAFAVLVLSLIAALALSSAFRRAVAAPIIDLAHTARIVSREKNYAVRASAPKSGDELSILIVAFNEMLEQIQQRDFALETERTRLSAIIENAPFGIVVAEGPSGRIVIANHFSEQIVGGPITAGAMMESYRAWTLKDAAGEVLPLERYPLTRALTDGQIVRSEEIILSRPNGEERWLRVFAAPVRDKSGAIVAAVLAFSDIQDAKRAQEALLQSEKLAAAGRLAASISHEINNPLESVTNLLFLALSDSSLSARSRDYLQQADQELARVTHIATQTLRFYRQSTNPTSADLGELADSVLRLLKGRIANAQVDVLREYRAHNKLLCFEGELRQVFTNLIGNAIDAVRGERGRIIVRTSDTRNWKNGATGIRVSVCDNGQGISPEALARIFEPFYSTKGNLGTGLGLWVSKEIVHKHGGVVRVRSTKGVATTFSIFFPLDGVSRPNSAAA